MEKFVEFTNKQLLLQLKEVLACMEVENANKFKIRAYQNAIVSIENLTSSVFDLWLQNKTDEISGIGAGLKSHLTELFTNGKVSDWQNLKQKVPAGMFELLSLRGVGAKTAYTLATHFNINSRENALEIIKKAAEDHQIQVLPRFGAKSEQDILQAIEESKKDKSSKPRTLLVNGQKIAEKIINYMKTLDCVVSIDSLGSLRRKMPTVGDIDFAVITTDEPRTLDYFVAFSDVKSVLVKGDKMASVLLGNDLQIDMLVANNDSYGSLLQHFTGSKQHNVLLRTYALEKGLSISQNGIKQGDNLLHFKNETEFYNYLGLDYIPPELREGKNEIDLALNHNLPNLVQLSDIKGDIHMHSTYSDGANSIEDMVLACLAKNYLYMGIADHAPSEISRGVEEVNRIIDFTRKEIDDLNKKYPKIKVLYGYEVNILNDATLGLSNENLQKLDYVIASIHTSFDQSKEIMTNRFLKTLENPYVSVIGHPSGRVLLERDPVKADWEQVFNATKHFNKVLEINAQPSRLDLAYDLIYEALARGIKLIINTDAHHKEHLDYMIYGIYNAQKGWCTKNNIINTLPTTEFLKHLTNK